VARLSSLGLCGEDMGESKEGFKSEPRWRKVYAYSSQSGDLLSMT